MDRRIVVHLDKRSAVGSSNSSVTLSFLLIRSDLSQTLTSRTALPAKTRSHQTLPPVLPLQPALLPHTRSGRRRSRRSPRCDRRLGLDRGRCCGRRCRDRGSGCRRLLRAKQPAGDDSSAYEKGGRGEKKKRGGWKGTIPSEVAESPKPCQMTTGR
jgi:hypothetical protein